MNTSTLIFDIMFTALHCMVYADVDDKLILV